MEHSSINFNGKFNYSPAPESTDHIKLKQRYSLFINGEFVPPKKGQYLKTINPANEEPLAEVALADESDIELAVKAAKNALPKWQSLSPSTRGKYIYRIARIIAERSRELAVIESLDGGKPIRESKTVDIPLASAHFFYYAGWADKLKYAFPGKTPLPIGVCAQIIPWNFPLLMAAWKIAPALATGNTVILKPAETTPLTSLLLSEIISEANLPPGVVNIVTGAGKTGESLVKAKGINKIAFTGSTIIGKEILKNIANKDIKYTLELGGKSANIVFEDAAIDQALEGIINSIFFNQGHVCCAGSRLLVQESIYNNLITKLKLRMETLIVGDPLDKNTDIGAINSKPQLEKINYYLKLGEKEGIEIYQTNCSLPTKGYWCKPTLFLKASQSSAVVQDEIFGPVLTIQTFTTPKEAIEKANNTPYGLAGGVWTDKGSKAFKVSNQMRAGVVWANTYNKFDPTSPFGGYKESGIGREGGISGLEPYLNLN